MITVGNGKDTFFWIDNWLFIEPIINFAIVDIDTVKKYKHVEDYWDLNLGWRWEKFIWFNSKSCSRETLTLHHQCRLGQPGSDLLEGVN